MKKYITFISAVLFLTACVGTNSYFINVSMPNFKPQVPLKIKSINPQASIILQTADIEQNNNYSDDFENSILKIRIEKEIELLKENLEEQMKTIAQLKGYKIVDSNPDYILKSLIKIYIEEKDIQKINNFMSGNSIKSNLNINFKSKIDFIDAHNKQNLTHLSSNTKLDSSVSLNYPIKSNDGVNIFKTTISTVPTQLNKGLEKPAFEIDKAFLAFYKNTLNTLYSNLPKARNKISPRTNNFNKFNNDKNAFEENLP